MVKRILKSNALFFAVCLVAMGCVYVMLLSFVVTRIRRKKNPAPEGF